MNDEATQRSLPGKVMWAGVGMVVGTAVAFALVVAVELLSAVVHPFPEDFGGTQEEVCAHVERYPTWVLAAVIPIWGFTAYVGTWTARRIGGIAAGLIVALLLMASLIVNLSMLPYPIWFKAGTSIGCIVAIGLAMGRFARRPADKAID